MLCVCESIGKNYQHGKVIIGLIYLESVTSEHWIIIDESGDRDIVIDESGGRYTSIIEGMD